MLAKSTLDASSCRPFAHLQAFVIGQSDMQYPVDVAADDILGAVSLIIRDSKISHIC
jgi:hypothetical protein